jgi:hypothetical protein
VFLLIGRWKRVDQENKTILACGVYCMEVSENLQSNETVFASECHSDDEDSPDRDGTIRISSRVKNLQGRCIVWNNKSLLHQDDNLTVDSLKAGISKAISFFLVDPSAPVIAKPAGQHTISLEESQKKCREVMSRVRTYRAVGP